MDSNQPKTGKFSLNYGLILGALGVVFGLMLYYAEAHTTQSPAVTVISIVMMVAVTFWGINNFKKANGGYLKVGQALKLGAGIALIAGIITVLYTIFVANVLDPDFASKIMDARLAEAAAEHGLTQEQVQQQKDMGIKFFWMGYPVILIFNILLGLVIGLVAGLILKKASQP